MAKLIINGDDFGLSLGVNRGIVHLFDAGILTSTTLMVNQVATDQAIEFALQNPEFEVGIHLNLSTGRPLLPLHRVRTLVDGDGKFLRLSRLMIGAITGLVKHNEIRDELSAQIECCQREGLRLIHLDSHNQIHAMPIMSQIVVAIARQFGIKSIRTPRISAVLVPQVVRLLGFTALRLGGSSAARKNPEEGATSPDWRSFKTTSYLVPLEPWLGDKSVEDLYSTLSTLNHRSIEIVSHPAFVDEELYALSNYVQKREEELQLLSSRKFRSMLDDLNYTPANFRNL
jgi:predicted glycoside hydrolase/deacetylase ChbG (UPF0249 family)